jgi:hypothetical protein
MKDHVEMTEMVSHVDIRALLGNFSAAIELDQRLVDALPATAFHPQYNDEMWRAWRAGHVEPPPTRLISESKLSIVLAASAEICFRVGVTSLSSKAVPAPNLSSTEVSRSE